MPQEAKKPPASRLSAYVNKTVGFRFSGRDLTFHLSHGLFSSFDIDQGTRLLLKSIAQRIDLARLRSVLDVGCGVGVIGISIRARAPQAATVLQDRDALATALAAENCRANGSGDIEVSCGLAFQGLGSRKFDLVASNLPAKAGKPVLTEFFRGAVAFLSPEGTAAVVIVAPLAELARSMVRDMGCELVHSESTKQHTVLHVRVGRSLPDSPVGQDDLLPYIRTQRTFSHGEVSYDLQCAWSLPDFDTLGYDLALSFDLLSGKKITGKLLAWNPGQGHLPAYLVSAHGNAIASISIAGRDSLELAMTERNLQALGRRVAVSRAVPSEAWLADVASPGSVDFLCAAPHPVPRVPWQGEMAEAARTVVRPGGRLFLSGTSTDVHRFLTSIRGFRLIESMKHFGYRAALLARS